MRVLQWRIPVPAYFQGGNSREFWHVGRRLRRRGRPGGAPCAAATGCKALRACRGVLGRVGSPTVFAKGSYLRHKAGEWSISTLNPPQHHTSTHTSNQVCCVPPCRPVSVLHVPVCCCGYCLFASSAHFMPHAIINPLPNAVLQRRCRVAVVCRRAMAARMRSQNTADFMRNAAEEQDREGWASDPSVEEQDEEQDEGALP